MKTYYHQVLAVTVLSLMIVSPAKATTSVSQINVANNATCSSIASNAILLAKDTSVPKAGGSDTVTGLNGQVFQYSISSSNGIADNTLNVWTTNNLNGPIKSVNFVILKINNNTEEKDKSGNIGDRAFLYNNFGVITDNIMIAPTKIIAISFCAYDSSLVQELQQCSNCPSPTDPDIQARIVTQFDEPVDPNKGWQVRACACGQFKECNPELPAGTQVPEGEPVPCSDNNVQPFIPIDVTISGQSYYCTVINGSRRCYAKK